MSNQIRCQLLGSPKVLVNGEMVYFPFAKINALLYYILVNKSVSRDEAAGLFWPEMKEQNAKKNLRNAVYQTNKFLQEDVITSPNKVYLVLNEDIDIMVDVDLFSAKPKENLSIYHGDFLKGFFIKDAEEFEHWTVKMRNYYENLFVEECYQKIQEDIAGNETNEVERNIEKLIYIDELDERNYRLLMTYYQNKQQHGKVIETYYKLVDSLKNELGITPSDETKEIYDASLEKINPVEEKSSQRIHQLFFGRYREIQQIAQNMNQYKQNNGSKAMVLTGEAGVGKSALSNRTLDTIDKELIVFETQCYQAESKNVLRPWKKIIEKMSQLIQKENLIQPILWNEIMARIFPNFDNRKANFTLLESQENVKIDMLSQVIVEAIRKINLLKKTVFVFEDLQWMDEASLTLLTSVMLDLQQDEALFMFTLRDAHKSSVEYLLSTLRKHDRLLTIPVKPFTKEESEKFICKKLPNYNLTQEVMDNIYAHTEGNLFFLIEYISLLESDSNFDVMTTKMRDALKSRFLYLTGEERELVEIVSFFYDNAPIELIAVILQKDILAIANLVENLVQKNILKEDLTEDEISVQFTHIKLREYIYLNQSSLKKRVIHGKIAEVLEKQVDKKNGHDTVLYSKLSYHFAKANNELRAIEYKLYYLESNLTFHHELFPTHQEVDISSQENLPFNRAKIIHSFNKVRGRLANIEEEYEGKEAYEKLLIKFLYMEGRYLIRYGEYEQGLKDIKTVITKSLEVGDKEFILEGYKQMIYYFIQTENPEGMLDYVERALDLSIKENNHESIGILLRLKGLYYMMVGNTFLAEKLFRESINTFMITDKVAKNYSISIAASYNYIGEMRHNEGNYYEALAMFAKAIALCQDKSSSSYLSVFYINAGISSFALEDFQSAKEFFAEAYDLYGQFYSYWRRPILDSYMALVNLHEKNYEEALENISSSKKYSDKLANPRDKGTLYFSMAVIKNTVMSNHTLEATLQQQFDEALPESGEYYCQEALQYLNKNRDQFEIGVLETLFEAKKSY